jgi:hypothetical protein
MTIEEFNLIYFQPNIGIFILRLENDLIAQVVGYDMDLR